MTFLLILFFIAIALAPCFAAFRLGDYRLLAITCVCGLLSFLFVPFIISVVLVSRKLSKDQAPPLPFGVFAGFWFFLLFLFFILPFMNVFGVSANGYQFFQLSSLAGDASLNVVLFLIAAGLGAVISLLLRKRALFTGEMILMLNGYYMYALLAYNLFYYKIASYGTYLLLLMFLAGILMIYYMIAHMCRNQEGSINDSPQKPSSIPQPLRKLGTETAAALSGAAGKIVSAVNSSVSEMRKPSGIVICCQQGDYAGGSFTLNENEQLTLGSDPSQVNLVIASPEVSRLHCTIRCTGSSNTVQITDTSTNGTYSQDGCRLPGNRPVNLPLPCTIFFGNKPHIFRITKE